MTKYKFCKRFHLSFLSSICVFTLRVGAPLLDIYLLSVMLRLFDFAAPSINSFSNYNLQSVICEALLTFLNR